MAARSVGVNAPTGGTSTSAEPALLAVQGARIYPSPDEPSIPNGTVVMRAGRIEAVGVDLPIPPEARVLPGDGKFLTAGFWNAHVRFTERQWRDPARKSRDLLETQLQEMLTGRGFTTVVDTGSDPRVTFPLRQRIEAGGLHGPRIFTSGPGLYPPRGIPYYLRGSIPFWVRFLIPQPASPRVARRIAEKMISSGTDLVKLFTGSYIARGKVKNMAESVARAAVEVAHAHGQLAYSHASNLEGTRVAIQAGVDVLAHPPDSTEGIDESILRTLVDRQMAMTPTLKMFADTVSPSPEYLQPIYEVVRRFHALGGELLFGTDVGYLHDPSTDDEFRALERCGLNGTSILRMLTTAPAHRFRRGEDPAIVSVGRPADLVLLDRDPMHEVGAFAQVRATIRGGRILYLRS